MNHVAHTQIVWGWYFARQNGGKFDKNGIINDDSLKLIRCMKNLWQINLLLRPPAHRTGPLEYATHISILKAQSRTYSWVSIKINTGSEVILQFIAIRSTTIYRLILRLTGPVFSVYSYLTQFFMPWYSYSLWCLNFIQTPCWMIDKLMSNFYEIVYAWTSFMLRSAPTCQVIQSTSFCSQGGLHYSR